MQKRNLCTVHVSMHHPHGFLPGPQAMHPHIYASNCLTPKNIALPVTPRSAKEKQNVMEYTQW